MDVNVELCDSFQINLGDALYVNKGVALDFEDEDTLQMRSVMHLGIHGTDVDDALRVRLNDETELGGELEISDGKS